MHRNVMYSIDIQLSPGTMHISVRGIPWLGEKLCIECERRKEKFICFIPYSIGDSKEGVVKKQSPSFVKPLYSHTMM